MTLQVEMAIIAAVIALMIVFVIFSLTRKPASVVTDSGLKDRIDKLFADFDGLKKDMNTQMDVYKRNNTEDQNKRMDEMLKNANKDFEERSNVILKKGGVSREEFDTLKEMAEKMLGADEAEDKIRILRTLFDSSQIKTLNWQCRLVKLLNGGLAPDTEENIMVSEGIPKSSCVKFLKKLIGAGIAEERKVQAFYLSSGREWIYSYVENPDWLQKRLGSSKKEKDYQEYIRNNLNLVEEGLEHEHSEYALDTGKIDFICRDSNSRTVGLELKYPGATSSVKRQILGYKNDYEKKSGRSDSRFIVVAPSISKNLQDLLEADGIEWREVSF